jgi:chromosomal replication initiation ATPase DnaA
MLKMDTTLDYNTLQTSIDKVIGKIGLSKTIHLLDSFVTNTSIQPSEHDKIKVITQYLVSMAIKVFDLNEELFYVSNVREYKDARRCCFHLLRRYTGDTFPKIGIAFQCSERTVAYGYGKAAEYLAVPKGNTKFVSKYMKVESVLVEFIGKLN